MLTVVPLSFKRACQFVTENHRHHKKPQGHKFSIGVESDGELVGVAIVGRPVSRHRDDGVTAEVTRLCTDGTKNAASKLYRAAFRAAKNMGYKKLITYTLESEPGTSLRAAGMNPIGVSAGGSWSRPSRKREDKAPICKKKLWELVSVAVISCLLCVVCVAGDAPPLPLDWRNAIVAIDPTDEITAGQPFARWGVDDLDGSWKQFRDELTKPCVNRTDRIVTEQKARALILNVVIAMRNHQKHNMVARAEGSGGD